MKAVTVKEMRDVLDTLVKAGAGAFPCIYSSDDEGNSYHFVYQAPGALTIEDAGHGYVEISERDGEEGVKPNAVIIN